MAEALESNVRLVTSPSDNDSDDGSSTKRSLSSSKCPQKKKGSHHDNDHDRAEEHQDMPPPITNYRGLDGGHTSENGAVEADDPSPHRSSFADCLHDSDPFREPDNNINSNSEENINESDNDKIQFDMTNLRAGNVSEEMVSLLLHLKQCSERIESRTKRLESRIGVDDHDDGIEPTKKKQADRDEVGQTDRAFVLGNVLGNGGGDNEEEGSETTGQLPGDSFSFLVVSRCCSISFLSAIFVFIIQIATYFLLMLSMISFSDHDNNPIGIPANVEPTVRGTQIVAITITVLTQDDLRTGLFQINAGYNGPALKKAFPSSTYWNWLLSVLCRCFEGGLGLIVTFLLIVTAETVIDLLLNFTAMEFVSMLDEIFFVLASQGFAGRSSRECAGTLSGTSFPVLSKKRRCRLNPFILLMVLMATTMAGWVVVMQKQVNGDFLCDVIAVQFDDDLVPEMATFSGLYDRETESTGAFTGDRARYIERRSKRAVFAYCEELESWTFAYNEDDDGEENTDPCNYHARSEPMNTFDVTDTATATWFVKNERGWETSMDHFYMSCRDCGDETCGKHGKSCDDGVCTCDEGYSGPNCEFTSPCAHIETDSRFEGFLGDRIWSDQFKLLEYGNDTAEVYNHAIYFNEYADGKFDVIFFTGRRYALATSDAMYDLPIDDSDGDKDPRITLAAYFVNEFHAHWSKYVVSFVSDPMDVGTPTDGVSPVDLGWSLVRPKTDISIPGIQGADTAATGQDVSLLCAVCDNETNPCYYDGQCSLEGICACSLGSSGTLCQIPPAGNGHCDQFFNTPGYEYDGGDCCESTCVSNDEFTCGVEPGYIDDGIMNSGYHFCHLPKNEWHLGGPEVSGGSFAFSGTDVSLSSNGNVLAVGEYGDNSVRVFDRDGSNWVQRGREIQGPFGVCFGCAVVLEDVSQDAVANEQGLPVVTVAVPSNDGLRTYGCSGFGCTAYITWSSRAIYPVHVCLSSNGELAAYAESSSDYSNTTLRVVHVWNTGAAQRHVTVEGTVESFAMSGDASTLAVARYVDSSTEPSFPIIREAFSWDGTSYVRKGDKLPEPVVCCEDWQRQIVYYIPGDAVALSYNGDIFADSASLGKNQTGVRVYEFFNGTGWKQRGSTIEVVGEFEVTGWRVDLSGDGSKLVVKSSSYLGVYAWIDGDWREMMGMHPENVFLSMDLSSNGLALAVGDDKGNKRAGLTSVFTLTEERCTGDDMSVLRVSIESSKMLYWNLVSNTTNVTLLDDGPYTWRDDFLTVVKETCWRDGDCGILTVNSGFNLESSPIESVSSAYGLFLAGEVIGHDTFVDTVNRRFIGDCLDCPGEGKSLFQMVLLARCCVPVVWELRNGSGDLVADGKNFESADNGPNMALCDDEVWPTYWVDICIPYQDCLEFTLQQVSNRLTPNCLVGPELPFRSLILIDGKEAARSSDADATVPNFNGTIHYTINHCSSRS